MPLSRTHFVQKHLVDGCQLGQVCTRLSELLPQGAVDLALTNQRVMLGIALASRRLAHQPSDFFGKVGVGVVNQCRSDPGHLGNRRDGHLALASLHLRNGLLNLLDGLFSATCLDLIYLKLRLYLPHLAFVAARRDPP